MNFNYKAYDKSTGKTYRCFGFNFLEGEICVSSLSDDELRDGVAETIHSVTKKLNNFHILQPTGIEDIDGNEIFEGDIISATGEYGDMIKATVYWSYGSFYVANHTFKQLNNIKIIGKLNPYLNK